MNSDVLKQEDEIFCPECAKPIKKKAVICPNCGIQVKELEVSLPESTVVKAEKTITSKSKITAIALAMVLGIGTWIYTWQWDKWKFIVAIPSVIILSVISRSIDVGFVAGVIFMLWALIQSAIRSGILYENYPIRYLNKDK